MSKVRSLINIAAVSLLAIAAGVLLAHTVFTDAGSTPPDLAKATLLTPPRAVPAFEFTDHTNAPFDSARLKDRWSLMFFGFTRCPDVCPTTLGMLAQVEKSLADLPAAQRPQVLLVSVDPQRDTPQQLASYVPFFNPSFTGLTGSQDAINEFTRAMGVPVAIQQLENGDYTVDHSAAIFLIDPNGAWRALFSTPHVPAVIAADYRRIVVLR